MRPHLRPLLLIAVLLLGGYTRFAGLTRGQTDLPLGAAEHRSAPGSFYHFHPDEATLVRAARALRSPFEPPITAYGLVPIYVARGVLDLADWFSGSPAAPRERHGYVALRCLSALLSVLCLPLVWLTGRRFLDRDSALLAVYFVAVAPVAIQQAHFYTVDGLFALVGLAAFALSLRAVESVSWRWFATSGLLIGLAGAIRLNGLLLGLVLAAGMALLHGPGALRRYHLWLAALVAALTLALLEPYLLTNPGMLFTGHTTDDLHFSLQVARGEILRSWTVADLHTVPYLHYWTDLWPLSVGWPLTIAVVIGIGFALWHRHRVAWLILLWTALYFALIGALHTKHVRYLLPLLPFGCLLAANVLGFAMRSRWRPLGLGIVAAVAVPAGVYGLAFTRLYTVEDSRLAAARWMETNLPSGARVGVERGGFTMLPLLRQDRFHPVVLNVSTLFEARGYMSCGAQFEYLRHDRLLDLDFITFIDVNRYAQYVAAPRLLPVAAGFYARLLQGNLGFERVGRFKNYPAVMGLEFGDDGAEASFIGYDHPAVYLFRRTNNREVETAMNRWRRDLTANAACPDELLGAAALALRQQRLSTVDEVTRTAATRFPGLRLLHLINAEANRRRGRPYARELDLFVAGFRNRATHVLPWASAMSFAVLDLPELALSVLRQFGSARHYPSHYHRDLSQSYLILANLLYRRGELPVAGQVYQLAAALHPAPAASNRLAVIAYRGGRHAEAAAHWTKSLRLDASQAGIHANLGQILAKHLGTPERARYHLRRAVELDPMLEPELSGWIADLGPGEDLAAPLPPDRDPGADPPLRHRPRSARDDAVQ